MRFHNSESTIHKCGYKHLKGNTKLSINTCASLYYRCGIVNSVEIMTHAITNPVLVSSVPDSLCQNMPPLGMEIQYKGAVTIIECPLFTAIKRDFL